MDSSKEDQDTDIDLGGLQTLIVVDFYMISWKREKNKEKIKKIGTDQKIVNLTFSDRILQSTFLYTRPRLKHNASEVGPAIKKREGKDMKKETFHRA